MRYCVFSIALLLLALTVCGCGRPTGSVSGKVTYRGAALPGGQISFLGSDGKVVAADIGADGTYTAPGVVVGEARVTVDNSLLRLQAFASHGSLPAGVPVPKTGPAADSPMPVKPGKYVPIPERYRNPEQSGLTCRIERGSHTFDVDLK